MLEVRHLTKRYLCKKTAFTVLDNVSFTLTKGEVLGLVGGSGSGKSTLARLLMRLQAPTSGQILLDDQNITYTTSKSLCRRMQMVFQDPYSSLNPRMTVGDLLREPLEIHHLPDSGAVDELLDLVSLPLNAKSRYPHEFSGGQRQRIALARALILKPDILILDEPISALDVSIAAQILALLLDLKNRLKLSYLFIAHDLAVMHQVTDRIAVMSQGQITEIAPTATLFKDPQHPSTQQLLAAIPAFKREHWV